MSLTCVSGSVWAVCPVASNAYGKAMFISPATRACVPTGSSGVPAGAQVAVPPSLTSGCP